MRGAIFSWGLGSGFLEGCMVLIFRWVALSVPLMHCGASGALVDGSIGSRGSEVQDYENRRGPGLRARNVLPATGLGDPWALGEPVTPGDPAAVGTPRLSLARQRFVTRQLPLAPARVRFSSTAAAAICPDSMAPWTLECRV